MVSQDIGKPFALHNNIDRALHRRVIPSKPQCLRTIPMNRRGLETCTDFMTCRFVRSIYPEFGQWQDGFKCVPNIDLPNDDTFQLSSACPVGQNLVLNKTDAMITFLFCNHDVEPCPSSTNCYPHSLTQLSVCCSADPSTPSQPGLTSPTPTPPPPPVTPGVTNPPASPPLPPASSTVMPMIMNMSAPWSPQAVGDIFDTNSPFSGSVNTSQPQNVALSATDPGVNGTGLSQISGSTGDPGTGGTASTGIGGTGIGSMTPGAGNTGFGTGLITGIGGTGTSGTAVGSTGFGGLFGAGGSGMPMSPGGSTGLSMGLPGSGSGAMGGMMPGAGNTAMGGTDFMSRFQSLQSMMQNSGMGGNMLGGLQNMFGGGSLTGSTGGGMSPMGGLTMPGAGGSLPTMGLPQLGATGNTGTPASTGTQGQTGSQPTSGTSGTTTNQGQTPGTTGSQVTPKPTGTAAPTSSQPARTTADQGMAGVLGMLQKMGAASGLGTMNLGQLGVGTSTSTGANSQLKSLFNSMNMNNLMNTKPGTSGLPGSTGSTGGVTKTQTPGPTYNKAVTLPAATQGSGQGTASSGGLRAPTSGGLVAPTSGLGSQTSGGLGLGGRVPTGLGTGTQTRPQTPATQVKAGKCPVPHYNDGLGCISRCTSDQQCAGTAKCCPTACRSAVCRLPVKPGHCPRANSFWNFFCWNTCSDDHHCAGSQKCCYDGSCFRCSNPLMYNPQSRYQQYQNQNLVNRNRYQPLRGLTANQNPLTRTVNTNQNPLTRAVNTNQNQQVLNRNLLSRGLNTNQNPQLLSQNQLASGLTPNQNQPLLAQSQSLVSRSQPLLTQQPLNQQQLSKSQPIPGQNQALINQPLIANTQPQSLLSQPQTQSLLGQPNLLLTQNPQPQSGLSQPQSQSLLGQTQPLLGQSQPLLGQTQQLLGQSQTLQNQNLLPRTQTANLFQRNGANQNQVYPNQNQFQQVFQQVTNNQQQSQLPRWGTAVAQPSTCPPYSGNVAGCRSTCQQDSQCAQGQKCCRVGNCAVCLTALPSPTCNTNCNYGYTCQYNTCYVTDRTCRHTAQCLWGTGNGQNGYNRAQQNWMFPLMWSIFS